MFNWLFGKKRAKAVPSLDNSPLGTHKRRPSNKATAPDFAGLDRAASRLQIWKHLQRAAKELIGTGTEPLFEWSAACDQWTCALCRERDSKRFTYEEALALLTSKQPFCLNDEDNANCRCLFLPYLAEVE